MKATQILIIEDNPMDLRLLRKALEATEDWPIDINVAVDGEQAIDYLTHPDTPKPDLAVLDLNLPKRDGLEVLQIIRIADYLYRLPVVVFTSLSEDVVKTKLEKAKLDADLYLVKPANIADFLELGRTLRDFYMQLAS